MDLEQTGIIRITCAPGLGPFLEQEVEALGYVTTVVDETGVEVEATYRDALRLNLHLRTAFSVLYLLHEFRCAGPDELYRHTSFVNWEDLLSADGYLSVISRVNTPVIDNWTYASLKVKDAIVDRMMEKVGRRPDSGPLREQFVVNLYWTGDHCRLYLNTSGRKLSDRGYRKMPHKAPMQETLAAGVVMATGYDGSEPLVNPMCGSGTLAIEAALLATKRAPGLLRSHFALTHVKGFDESAWQNLRVEARKRGKKAKPAPIIATDIDEKAVAAARQNALTAGVQHLIDFHVCDFADTPIPDGNGIVILNPEYGVRMGEIAKLEGAYKRIGDFLKQKCSGGMGYVFTGNLSLAKRIGLRTRRRIPFFNARIECRLLEYELYDGSRRRPRDEKQAGGGADCSSPRPDGV